MDNRPHYLGHRKRLKEKFLKIPSAVADYELLELFLGYALPRKDTKPIAKEMIARFGDLQAVMQACPAELEAIPGVGPGVSLFFQVVRELRIRKEECAVKQKQIFSGPESVVSFVSARIGGLKKEEFWVVLVDNKNRLVSFERISKGTVDQTAVYPREVMALVFEKDASGVILAHNHPGGDPQPSRADKDLTAKLAGICKEMGIRLLDHIVVTSNDYYSFQENGGLCRS